MRIAVYARVSRDDGVQDENNQVHQLHEWAGRLGGNVVAVYVDRVSGKAGAVRPQLERVLEGAHRREFDELLVWALDRLSRGGIETTIALLRRLQASGVIVRSLRETWLNTSDPHVCELLIAIMSWLAKTEREQLIARVKAGIERARRQGKRIGRERIACGSAAYIRAVVAKVGSIRAAATELHVDEKTLRNRLRMAG